MRLVEKGRQMITVTDLQKLWDDSQITFEVAGQSGRELESIVEQLDDGIFFSHFDGGDLVDLEKLGDTPEEAETKLQKLIADYS